MSSHSITAGISNYGVGVPVGGASTGTGTSTVTINDYLPGSVIISNNSRKGITTGTVDGTSGSTGGSGSGLSSYSGISTLERQYVSTGTGNKSNLLLFVRTSPECCLPGGVEQLLRIQQQQNQSNTSSSIYETTTASTSVQNDSGYVDWDGGNGGILQQQQQQQLQQQQQSQSTSYLKNGIDTGTSLDDGNDYEIGSTTKSTKSKVNRLFKMATKVAGKTVTSIERQMQTLAVKADAGRNPDNMVIGLYWVDPTSYDEILLSASESQSIQVPSNSNSTTVDGQGPSSSSSLQFVIPLVLPTFTITSIRPFLSNPTVIIKLWIRSGATTSFLSKYHWLGSSVPLNIFELTKMIPHSNPTSANPLPAFLRIPLQPTTPYIPNGQLYLTVIEDCKYPTPYRRGWSICDPINIITSPSNTTKTWYNLPLHQSYGFSCNSNTIQTGSSILLAIERSIESTVVMPIAAAVAKLVHVASIQSLYHSQSVQQNILLSSRHDTPAKVGPYIDTTLTICYVQPIIHSNNNTDPTGLHTNVDSYNTNTNNQQQQQVATITAFWQRPNSIFEVDLTSPEQQDVTPIRVPVVQSLTGRSPPPSPPPPGSNSNNSTIRFYPKPLRHGILPAVFQEYGGKVPAGTGFFLGNVRIQLQVSASTSSYTSSSSVAAAAASSTSSSGALTTSFNNTSFYNTNAVAAAASASASSTAALFRSARNQFATSTTNIVPQNPFDAMCGGDTTTTTTTTSVDPTPSPNQLNQQQQQQKQPSGFVQQQQPPMYDSYYGSSTSTQIWECIIPLETLYQQCQQSNNNNTKGFTVIDPNTGRPVATLFTNVTMEMKHNPVSGENDTIINRGGIVPASGGLVQLMGLDTLLSDGICPALDVDETPSDSSGTTTHASAAPTTTTTLSPEEQRRRSQLRTMGNFINPEYLDQHIQLFRTKDVELFHQRSTEYAMAINNAIATAGSGSALTTTTTTVPEHSYMDRTPKPFRPSSSRSDMLLSGIPFNVHTATLALDVLEPPGKSSSNNNIQKGAVFVNTTHGAPADHSRGFGNVFAISTGTKAIAAVGLNSPVGPAIGGLRRLEAKRTELATAVSNLQTELIMSIGNFFMEQRQRQQQKQPQLAVGAATAANYVPARNKELQTLRWKVFEAVQCLHHLTWACAVRRASVFSQALGIAVSTYLGSLTCDTTRILQSTWPAAWVKHGYLICYEGLLSAVGKELGMMEDASTGISMLRTVQMILVPDDGRQFPPPVKVGGADAVPVPFSPFIRWISLTKQGQAFVLQIGITQSYYNERIPNALKNGAPVRFYPIMFEVGVDIRQWGANTGSNMIKRGMSAASSAEEPTEAGADDEVDEDTVGVSDTDVLVQLNYEAFQKMNEYAYTVSPPQQVPPQQVPGQSSLPPHPYLAPLYHHIVRSAGKMNHDILDLAATLAQQLGGGGAVFCKSGKDRTAMHVTYKQAQFINNFRNSNQGGTVSTGQTQPDAVGGAGLVDTTLSDANLLRIYGTRLPICEKNVGQAKFAFNSLQVKFMPDALKPPSSTLAGFLKGGKVFGGGGIES